MAGFYSILSKGIAALDPNTPEARRRLYERAIAALVAEMRGTDPALDQSEFQVAWKSLKEAIVKIETEAEAEIEAEAEVEAEIEARAETEAEIEAEAEAKAEAEAQRDRLIHRPKATTSTSLRRGRRLGTAGGHELLEHLRLCDRTRCDGVRRLARSTCFSNGRRS